MGGDIDPPGEIDPPGHFPLGNIDRGGQFPLSKMTPPVDWISDTPYGYLGVEINQPPCSEAVKGPWAL